MRPRGGSNGDAGHSVDDGMPSDVYPAPHPPAPRVETLGGPVLKAPKIHPVFFADDDRTFTDQVTDFVEKVGATAYWTAAVHEYGGGAAVGQPAIHLTEVGPTTIDKGGIESWLAGKLDTDDPLFPVPDDDTLIAIFYPGATTIVDDALGTSCQAFDGFHTSTVLDAAHGKRNVPYAVIARCYEGPRSIDLVTIVASHELLEATTDPLPEVDPAYRDLDAAHAFWRFPVGGSETADMCGRDQRFFMKLPGLGYSVQRSWSNEAAAGSHYPCAPGLPDEPYFNSVPILEDTLAGGVGVGVRLAPGEKRTVEIALFSDAPTEGPWTVEAFDLGIFGVAKGEPPRFAFSFDRTTGVNGEKLHLQITRLEGGANVAHGSFSITSTLGDRRTEWLGVAGD